MATTGIAAMRVYVLLQTRRSNLGDRFGENWLAAVGWKPTLPAL